MKYYDKIRMAKISILEDSLDEYNQRLDRLLTRAANYRSMEKRIAFYNLPKMQALIGIIGELEEKIADLKGE